MSKAPKNIEKILLGVGLLAGAGLGALGFLQLGKADEDFNKAAPNPGVSDVEVPGAEKVPGTINSLQSDRSLAAGQVESNRLESGQRDVDLFVGVPLFAPRENQNEPVDLLQSDDVHPPIPNQWWLKYDVSPNFADSPQRDADSDGFSNLEEFEAETLPNDRSSHPELATKLAYIGDESKGWFLEYGLDMNGQWIPKIQDLETGEKNRVDLTAPLKEGETFFKDEPFKGRFKFLRIEERTEMNERLNYEQTLKYGIFEDLKANKKGTTYEVPSSLPRAERPKYHRFDRTAVLELRAVGQEGKQFKVEENTRFSLPPGGDDKKYLLKSVTPEEVEIEWDADGETQSRVIPKR